MPEDIELALHIGVPQLVPEFDCFFLLLLLFGLLDVLLALIVVVERLEETQVPLLVVLASLRSVVLDFLRRYLWERLEVCHPLLLYLALFWLLVAFLHPILPVPAGLFEYFAFEGLLPVGFLAFECYFLLDLPLLFFFELLDVILSVTEGIPYSFTGS